MFDNITCKYALPLPWANALHYQTKDTSAQYLDNYEIREDGTLWHELYDTEDQSDLAKWEAANPGKEAPAELQGMRGICGCAARINTRWEPEPITGEIVFYTSLETDARGQTDGWLEWSAYFENGKVSRINLLEHTPAKPKPQSPMSTEEAKEYVDVVIEELVDRKFISPETYGRMPADLSEQIAEKVVAKSEE